MPKSYDGIVRIYLPEERGSSSKISSISSHGPKPMGVMIFNPKILIFARTYLFSFDKIKIKSFKKFLNFQKDARELFNIQIQRNVHIHIHMVICSYIHIFIYSYIHVFIYSYIHILLYS